MKTLVVYRSHYGSTRRYAQWLAQALDADAAEERQADARLVQNYECVIFGGGLYAGSIAGAARMAKLYGALQGKRLAMFTVGLSDPSDPENVKKIMQDAARAFTPEMLENICFFHLRGGMDYRNMRPVHKAMRPVHKAMMAMLKKMLLKKPESERSTEEKGLLAAYDRPVDFTDRAALAPLIAWCRDEA